MSKGARKLPGRDETEVYASDDGMVEIRQSDPLGNEPSIVRFAPHEIPLICEWLTEAAQSAMGQPDTPAAEIERLRGEAPLPTRPTIVP